jgi:hypothetical protein
MRLGAHRRQRAGRLRLRGGGCPARLRAGVGLHGDARADARWRAAVFIPLAVVIGVASGCVLAKKIRYDAAACALGQVPSAVAATVDEAKASLAGDPGAPSWDPFANGALLAKDDDAAICIIEAALHDLDGKLPDTAVADASGQLDLQATCVLADAAGGWSCPDPRVYRAHERGVEWLAAHRVSHHHHRAHGGGQ